MTQSGTSGGDRRLSVLVLTRHGRRGAASRLRLLDLLPGLVDSGIDATARAFFDDSTLDRRNAGRRVQTAVSALDAGLRRVTALIGAGRYDVVLIEKEALPFVPWPVEGALLAGSRVVVDLGDARFLRYQSHRSPLVRRMLGGKIAALLRRAHVAVVGNAPLEAWARSAGARDVVVLPTSIDLARYRPRDAESEPRRPFTIGWIGSATTAGYLLPVAAVLAELARRRDVEVHLVGAGRCAPPGVRACSFAWAE